MVKNVLEATWAIDRDPLLLGSCIIAHMELQLAARAGDHSEVRLHVSGAGEHPLPAYVAQAFAGTVPITIQIGTERPDASCMWPATASAGCDASYGSLERVEALAAAGQVPHLRWSADAVRAADDFRTALPGDGPVVALHVRMAADATGYGAADVDAWSDFIADAAADGIRFVMLGHDAYPRERFPAVTRAGDCGLNLTAQLALSCAVDGYIGMASGISNAPVFSATPYVIFKHPLHHAGAIERELDRDRFRIARGRQSLWRKADSHAALRAALDAVLGRA